LKIRVATLCLVDPTIRKEKHHSKSQWKARDIEYIVAQTLEKVPSRKTILSQLQAKALSLIVTIAQS